MDRLSLGIEQQGPCNRMDAGHFRSMKNPVP